MSVLVGPRRTRLFEPGFSFVHLGDLAPAVHSKFQAGRYFVVRMVSDFTPPANLHESGLRIVTPSLRLLETPPTVSEASHNH